MSGCWMRKSRGSMIGLLELGRWVGAEGNEEVVAEKRGAATGTG